MKDGLRKPIVYSGYCQQQEQCEGGVGAGREDEIVSSSSLFRQTKGTKRVKL